MNQIRPLRWIRGYGPISGVCDGLGRAFAIPAWVVRMAFLFALLFFGSGFFLYLFLWIAFPREERAEDKRFLGVCLKVARATDLEVGIVRLGTLFLLLISFVPAVVGYFVLYFVVPPYPSSS